MTHTLVTFLGFQPGKDRKGYPTAQYDFGSGPPITTGFFALALLEHLRATAQDRPDRLIILGTSGSMWDSFIDTVLGFDTDAEIDELGSLTTAVLADCVDQPWLDRYRDRLSSKLGIDCAFVLIPYAKDIGDQIGILQTLTSWSRKGDLVSLDLTHGLRHLPVLGMLSAMLIEATGMASIGDIYYGAFDLKARFEGRTPVLRLGGLTTIARWLAAFQVFDRTGDYGVFAPLLVEDGGKPETARLLRTASFFVQVNQIEQAQVALHAFRKRLAIDAPDMRMMRLFGSTLDERLAWAETGDPYMQLRDLAFANLKDEDYMLAAVRGFEAFLRRLPPPPAEWLAADHANGREKGDVNKRYYESAIRTGKSFKSQTDVTRRRTYADYECLRDMRNASVHVSVNSNRRAKDALKSPESCATLLKQLFNVLLPVPEAPDRRIVYG